MSKAMLIDQTKCIGCSACTVACKNIYDHTPFGVLRTSMQKYEQGSYPNTSFRFRKVMCMHCQNGAPCIDPCPVDAISYKGGEDGGIVLIDDDACIGCGLCVRVCPFGAPKMDDDRRKADKCTFCEDQLVPGEPPYCYDACPVGAITFGEQEEVINAGEARVSQLKNAGRNQASLYGTEDAIVYYVLDAPASIYDLPKEGYTLASLGWKTITSPVGSLVALAAMGSMGLTRLRNRMEEVEKEENK